MSKLIGFFYIFCRMTDDDRSWMYERLDNKKQITQSFVNGVFQFLEFAFTHASSSREGGQIKCPCTKCCCSNKEDRDTMTLHLYKFGFMGDYTNWDRHGEPRKRPHVEVCITPHDVEMVEEIIHLLIWPTMQADHSNCMMRNRMVKH